MSPVVVKEKAGEIFFLVLNIGIYIVHSDHFPLPLF